MTSILSFSGSGIEAGGSAGTRRRGSALLRRAVALAWMLAVVLLASSLTAPAAFAAGTAAGTAITNSATLTYVVGAQAGLPITAVAPVVTVAELIDVLVTWQDGSPVAGNSPDPAKTLTFLLTNTGNGAETFRMVRNNAVAGDQFDPVSIAGGDIFIENGLQPGFQASGPNADLAYIPGVNDPALAADASRAIYLVSSLPAGQATGALGAASLTVSSTTTGAPGTVPGTTLAGLGQGGVRPTTGEYR